MPVTSTHPTYDDAAERWQTVRDAIAGQQAIKAAGTRYLPGFVPEDKDRYKAYKLRARFLNITGRTKQALVGAVFRRKGQCDLPATIEYLRENADGGGESIEQIAKRAVDELIGTGRYGLLVDYPQAEPGMTREQVAALNLQATIAPYCAEAITHWKTSAVNGKQVLSMVKLKEEMAEEVDEFTSRKKKVYRVLRLENGVYTQTLYDEHEEILAGPSTPRANGSLMSYIPFVFMGAMDNKPGIDESPLYDLATTNISHYQVSADHMENLHIHGQLTLGIASSLSNAEFKEANPNGVFVGSRAGHYLGENGNFVTATAPESSSLSKALDDLKADMIAIGGRIVQPKGGNRTAEEARIDAASEHSVLQTLVDNASEGIEKAIEFVCDFMGANPDEAVFKLNTEFFPEDYDPQEIMARIAELDRGLIAKKDYRDWRRRTGGIAGDRTDEEIDEEVNTGGLNLV
jgi:hypothetical protein